MTVFLWRFALFTSRTLVHGDAIIFGMPLFELRARFVEGRASALWADTIFGGHPLFAEGQGGFLNPIAMLLALIGTPMSGAILAANLFRVACMILTGLGVLGLARSLGIGRWAAAFAALAVLFSPLWLYMQTNPGLSGPYLFVPWCLWAMEIWLKRPTGRTAVLMGVAMASLILAGYPQAFHGTVVYMAMTLLAVPFDRRARQDWSASWRLRLATGALAAILCATLAAVQLLPLAELVGLSHRSGGVALQFQLPPKYYLRGFFYTLDGDVRTTLAFPAIGSLIVCILASLMPLFVRSSRLTGHFFAAIVLMQLGMGNASPLFRFVYDHELLPGLNYFRGVALYLAQSTLGAAILAAAAIDGLAKWARKITATPITARLAPTMCGLAIATILWAWLLERVRTPEAPLMQFAIVAAVAIGIALLARRGRTGLIPPLVLFLLVVECANLRLQPFHFGRDALLAEPGPVRAIKAMPDWRDYKVIDATAAPAYAFLDSKAPGVDASVRRVLAAMSGLTPVLWELHGMDGALALPLARLMESRPLLYDEILGKTSSMPGVRLIDFLGIRFISVDAPVTAPSLRPFWHETDSVFVMENTAARPRFQAYGRHISVPSFDAALAAIRVMPTPELVIENPPGPLHVKEPDDDSTGDASPPLSFEVKRAEATDYRFDVRATRPGWLFVADANYPGWQATIDGNPTPVFTAQILGKAVAIPEGRHQVRIGFHPASVRDGVMVSLVGVAIAVFALIFGPKMSSWRTQAGRNRS